ncbi:hypothetical protein EHS13_15460 [Paenibacillus psychroresistens]|uniref:Uncharacterized protein n=1 Tax=Paenibacillus psychroresistens TaxID=1778678 RepID=A0A6B8RK94_9BACL|nr:hypothetical protein [Paenibacillus psychroresistens]QGQ96174.1 hypothetical protein EHS13_15460 [Paenibacillus psychroresistens]
MTTNNKFALIIMLWVTLLTVWVVTNLKVPPNNNVLSLQGIPAPAYPVQTTTVQIDKDTVWIIDPNSTLLKVITHDQDGYHLTQIDMPIISK